MPLGQRVRLFFLYYIILWISISCSIFFDVFAAQSQLIDTKLSNLLQINLLSGEHLNVFVSIIFCLFISVVPALILLKFKNRLALVLLTIILFFGVLSWWIAFSQYDLVFPFFYSLASFGTGLLVAIFIKMIFSSVEKDFLRAAFTQFVSEDMLKELLKDPNKLRLTGKEYAITVMFLDIRGFTSYSEKKSPAIVVNRLNELLDLVTHIIIKHDGTVDKYIGDCVMAFWGAPAADKKQASKACKAALEIKQKIEAETDFRIGIGINYGKAIVGNIGSSKRFDYTVIGDTVNSASRIEGLTKSLNASIVISESVLEKVKEEKNEIETIDLGHVLVKGKNQKLHVFGLQ